MLVALAVVLFCVFCIIGKADNKNNIARLDAIDGHASINYGELADNTVLALKNGWQIMPNTLYNGSYYYNAKSGAREDSPSRYTANLGEYSNYSVYPPYQSTGAATYRLYIETESGKLLSIHFPYIYSSNEIYVNGELKNRSGEVALDGHVDNTDSVTITFLTSAQNEIVVCATNLNDTYSGMYYLPILGNTDAITAVVTVNNLSYLGVLILAFMIFLITFIIWFVAKTRPAEYLYISIVCAMFILYIIKNTIVAAGLGYNVALQGMRCVGFWAIDFFLVLFARRASGVSKRNVYFQFVFWLGIAALVLTVCGFGLLNNFQDMMQLSTAISFLNKLNTAVFLVLCAAVCLTQEKQRSRAERKYKYILYVTTAVFCAAALCEATSNATMNPLVFLTTPELARFACVCCIGVFSVAFYVEVARQNAVMREKETQQYKLFSNVAHDIKSPVALLSAYIELLEGQPAKAEQLQIYRDIKQSGKSILERAEQLQRFAAIVDKNTVKERVSAIDFFDSISAAFAPIFQKKRLAVHKDIADIYICVNAGSFSIAIENIISNAIDFMDEGGDIYITCKRKFQKIQIEISNNGERIPSHALPYLFDRYYSLREQGTGLGLAITKAVVLAHNGEIMVSSGELTTFTIVIADMPDINKF